MRRAIAADRERCELSKQDSGTATHLSPSHARKYRHMHSASNSLGDEVDWPIISIAMAPQELLQKSRVPSPWLPPARVYGVCAYEATHMAEQGLPLVGQPGTVHTAKVGESACILRVAPMHRHSWSRQRAVKSKALHFMCLGFGTQLSARVSAFG